MTDRFEILAAAAGRSHELPDAWPPARLSELLATLDAGDLGEIAEADLRETLLMALDDLGADDGAEAVIDYRVQHGSDGRREQLVHEFRDEQPWAQYPTIAVHADLFAVAMLLHEAWPGVFRRPTLAHVRLEIRALDRGAATDLAALHPSLLARIVADADHAGILFRLFDDAVVGAVPFTDAPGILWRVDVPARSEDRCTVVIWSSTGWLEKVERGRTWRSGARPDA